MNFQTKCSSAKTSAFCPQACISIEKVCDASDDCGDLSDEEFEGKEGLCNGFRVYDFEDGSFGLFTPVTDDPDYSLQWVNAQPDITERLKRPLFDHSNFDIEYHYLHVGGLNPVVTAEGTERKKARLVSKKFVKMDDDEIGTCKIVFYYYNLGMREDVVGSLHLVLAYK